MDAATFPLIAAVMGVKPTIGHTLTPEVAAQLEPLLDQLVKHTEQAYGHAFIVTQLGGDFHNMVAAAFSAGLIDFAPANTLIRQLEPDATYLDFELGMWSGMMANDAEAKALNALKAALDTREPGRWLPNMPDISTLIEKAEELALTDPETLRGLRDEFVREDGLPTVLHL